MNRTPFGPRTRPGVGLLAGVIAFLVLGTACTSDSHGAGQPSTPDTLGGANSVAAPSSTAKATGRPTSTPTSAVSTTVPPTGSQPPQATRSPVAIDAAANFGGGVTGRITGIRSVQAKAVLPDEISGPALALTLRIENRSSRVVDLRNAVVNLAYGSARTPGSPMSNRPSRPFPATVAARSSVQGVYVFTVPTASQDGPLVVDVSYSPTAPRVLFAGSR